jgi:hypothetical protein
VTEIVLARQLNKGDVVTIRAGEYNVKAVVMAAVDSVQVVRKPVLMLTLRDPKTGRDFHRTFHPNSPVRKEKPA